MGLSAELLEDVTEAFDGELADAVAHYFITRRSAGTYSPVNGTNIITDVNTESIRGVAITFTEREIANSNGSIEVGDLRFLCIASELTVLSSIEIDDIITAGIGGQEYRVLSCPLDPTNTIYMLHLRLYHG